MLMASGQIITYSLYVPASLVQGLTFADSYAFLDDWVLQALRSLGIDATYQPLNDIASPTGKIGGAAQKRLANGGVLHHATISYDIDGQVMTEVLRIGKEKLSDKGTTSAAKRVDPLRTQTGLSRAEIIDSFKATFRALTDAEDGAVTADEYADAEALVESKFATDAWLHRVP
jgi:lipoate-protein ligase A